MSTWKDLLATAGTAQTLSRARSGLGRHTEYKLGQGGFDPTRPLTAKCDCSGFVAWAIGIPRELPPGSNRWLDTDAYHDGGGSVGAGLFTRVQTSQALPGDIFVYPDGAGGHSQGHMGILTQVAASGPTSITHCSLGGWSNHGDAVRETGTEIWTGTPGSRIMRIQYARMRELFGVQEEAAGVGTGTPGEAPVAFGAPVLHGLLANDPTLARVAAERLVLEPTGTRMAGIGTIQDALNVLGRKHPEYLIDLGPNRSERGFFGGKTATAIREFQFDEGLEPTGLVDVRLLIEIDNALREFEHEDHVAEEVSTTGQIVFTLRRDAGKWYAKADGGKDYFVGKETTYTYPSGERYRGLFNDGAKYPYAYSADMPEAQAFGHWRYIIAATTLAESGGQMEVINTYDKAYFTFGFFQLAAHVEEGDFVQFLRALLRRNAQAARYFPDLALNGAGHVSRRVDGTLRELENASSSRELMRYLNPSIDSIEETEVLQCARFIHWCDNDENHRKLQVENAVETAKDKLREQNRRYPLKNTRHPDPQDTLCVLIMDIIHHQGGSKCDEIDAVLRAEADVEKALTGLLLIKGAGRREKLRKIIAKMVTDGLLGTKRYSEFA